LRISRNYIEKATAIIAIGISPGVVHAMTSSTIWGTPTPEKAGRLPHIPIVSITRDDGEAIKSLLKRYPLKVRVISKVWSGWRKSKLVIAKISGAKEHDKYVLVGGHLDSWWYGATDNATGNATLLELARVLWLNRDKLRRGVKIAWWPGHSDGRYAGSTWYADVFFSDLYKNCVAYINIDSTGCKDFRLIYGWVWRTADVEELHDKTIADFDEGKPLNPSRVGRAGDHSFLNSGVASLATYAMAPPEKVAVGVGGSGGGWWWHTKYDTVDKVDFDILAWETQYNAVLIFRLCNSDILPLRPSKIVLDIVNEVHNLEAHFTELRHIREEAENYLTC